MISEKENPAKRVQEIKMRCLSCKDTASEENMQDLSDVNGFIYHHKSEDGNHRVQIFCSDMDKWFDLRSVS